MSDFPNGTIKLVEEEFPAGSIRLVEENKRINFATEERICKLCEKTFVELVDSKNEVCLFCRNHETRSL